MNPIRRWLQPSLAHRVLWTLGLAYLLVFTVLVARDYFIYRSSVAKREALHVGAAALEASLTSDSPSDVDVIMRSVEVQYRMLRRDAFERVGIACPGDVLFHVARPDGQVLYASQALGSQPLDRAGLNHTEVHFGGQAYWAAAYDTARWHITMFEPVQTDEVLIPALAREVMVPMSIAFPIIMLPLWLAVRRGLSPLRHLSEAVTQRQPQDFSPLAMDLPYAELKPLVQTFNELFARSRQSIARERAVVQDAAHELRTPLAVVSTQAHHLLNAQSAEERRAAKSALDHAIQRASHMAHQLLTLATLEGSEAPTQKTLDVVELTRQAVIALAPRAQACHIDVTLDSPDRLVARFDTQAYLSVLENLVVNAIHYGKAHGRVSVTIAPTPASHVTLTVADDGPGIDPQDLPHLFERFYRGRGVLVPGAGLGLAIVKQAVAHMNGQIGTGPGIDGAGLGFKVTFPTG